MLMSPVRQTVGSAVATVVIYGGFAVGYAALWIARKFWLLPVWWMLQWAAGVLMAHMEGAEASDLAQEILKVLVGATESVPKK